MNKKRFYKYENESKPKNCIGLIVILYLVIRLAYSRHMYRTYALMEFHEDLCTTHCPFDLFIFLLGEIQL